MWNSQSRHRTKLSRPPDKKQIVRRRRFARVADPSRPLMITSRETKAPKTLVCSDTASYLEKLKRARTKTTNYDLFEALN
jgi:hypothetical protein